MTGRLVPPGEPERGPISRQGKIVRIGSLAAARQVLRARTSTRQAGYTSEWIPQGRRRHHPILMSDGPRHDRQRAAVARFFAPAVVYERYPVLVEREACASLDSLAPGSVVELDQLAATFAATISAEILGLTDSPIEEMVPRLAAFFDQPSLDLTRPLLGRTPRDWWRAGRGALGAVARLYWKDVRPAIAARRCAPRDDVISHLLGLGWSEYQVAVECITYGTAGIVTTREFIPVVLLRLLDDEALRRRFESADLTSRLRIVAEVARLEPVVGHHYRRVVAPFEISDGRLRVQLDPGDLVDVAVRHTNTDESAVGDCPMALDPGRVVGKGVDPSGLTFGDGAHKCPGQHLALLETAVLVGRLLQRRPVIVREPDVTWNDLTAGFELRRFLVRLDA